MQGPMQQISLKKAGVTPSKNGLFCSQRLDEWRCGGTGRILAVGLGTRIHACAMWDSPEQPAPASTPWGAENAWEAKMHVDYLLFGVFPLMLLS